MRTLFSPHHSRVGILLMVIAMLATITSSIAAQNGDGVEAPPPEVAEDPVVPAETPAPPTVQPPIEPTAITKTPTSPAVPTEPQLSQPAPVDQPDNDAEPPAAIESDSGTPSRLTINTFHCVADWLQPHITRQSLGQRCTEPGTAAFTVVSDFGTEQASGTSFAFNVLGAITVTETMLQPGFDDPIVYCDVYGTDGAVAYELGPFESYLGEIHISDSNTGDLQCDWYQLDRSRGKLSIVNIACPHSASLAVSPPSMSELIAICTDPTGPVSFHVSDNFSFYETITSGGEFNQAYLGDIPYDRELTISADPPATFESARVFCQISWDGVEDPFREMLVTDFRISWKFLNGQRMHCNWFNIAQSPGLSQADNEPTVAPTTPSQSPGLSQGDDDPVIVPTATALPGGPGLSQGNATATPADPNQPTPTSGPGLSNGTTPVPTATVTLVPTATATAAPQPSNLMVSTYTCPAGYIPQSALAPFTDCTAGPNGVTFTVSDADPSTTDAQATTGAPIPNAVQFAGLQPGDYTLTAPLVSGSGSTFVLGCGASGSGPVETAVPGSLPLQVPAGMLLTCHWFNVPPPV